MELFGWIFVGCGAGCILIVIGVIAVNQVFGPKAPPDPPTFDAQRYIDFTKRGK